MNDANSNWNPDDGPPPTEEELRDAARLAEAIDHGGDSDDDAIAELAAAALRVRAIAHPDLADAQKVSQLASRIALAGYVRPAWWSRGPALRIAAAGVLLLSAAGAGAAGRYVGARSEGVDAPGSAFDAPVEPGAGSMPSTRLYDARLRSYRDAMLGGGR